MDAFLNYLFTTSRKGKLLVIYEVDQVIEILPNFTACLIQFLERNALCVVCTYYWNTS